MSRCCACNKRLTPSELRRKSINLGDYLDMCDWCYSSIEEEVPCEIKEEEDEEDFDFFLGEIENVS